MELSDYPKTVTLKDGSSAIMRPMVIEDLDALHRFFTEDVPEEDRMHLKDDVADREVLEGWASKLNYDKVLPILMLDGERIIADGTIKHTPRGWSSHLAEIRLVVSREYQGKGAGILLLKELVLLAQGKKADLLQAQVFENSPTGIAVFQKLGFRIEAVLRGFAMDIKGNRQNLVVLVRDVSELWKRMEDLLLESDWRGDS